MIDEGPTSAESSTTTVVTESPAIMPSTSTDATTGLVTPSVAAKPTTSSVRPFVRKVRARPADIVPDLIREIMQSQEKFNSRMSKFDKVIHIFQERFKFGLTAVQEMGFIALFSDSKSMVDQFFAFNDAQRDIFIQSKKISM